MTEQTTSNQMASFKDLEYSSVLKVRLDTSPLIEEFQIYLTGQISTIAHDKDGKPYIAIKKIAEPKANAEGQQWILNKLKFIVNPSTVQGNFVNESIFYHYLFNIRSSLIKNLMDNMKVWGIKGHNYEPIIDNFMDIVEPFMTRLLGNKERESYGGLKVIESTTLEQKDRGFSLSNPFRKGG